MDECRQLISQIKQMERSLAGNDDENDHDNKRNDDHDNDDDEFCITVPLLKCLQGLKEKHKLVKRRHAERYDSIQSTSSLLHPSVHPSG